jgi:DNA-binding CsgD family transcriptional regulator
VDPRNLVVRAGSDFTEREVEFLGAVAPAVAAATRLAVRAEVRGAGDSDGPAIALAGPRGEVRALTPAARAWQDRLEEVAPGRFAVMVRAAVVGSRSSGAFRARIRDARGGWLLLRASPLDDGDQTAVTFEAASGGQLLGLLLRAHGLTARERGVCDEVIAGRPTGDIAARLHISVHTVQDHLKSVFAKVGVRSRGELVARLR